MQPSRVFRGAVIAGWLVWTWRGRREEEEAGRRKREGRREGDKADKEDGRDGKGRKERERGEGGKWVRSEKGRELSGIQGAEMPSWEGHNAGGLYCVLQFFMSVPKN